jgi:hypothetical protein
MVFPMTVDIHLVLFDYFFQPGNMTFLLKIFHLLALAASVHGHTPRLMAVARGASSTASLIAAQLPSPGKNVAPNGASKPTAEPGEGFPPAKNAGGPLFTLPGDASVREFTATADLGGFAFVFAGSTVKAHMNGKKKNHSVLVHNGVNLGAYPDIMPFSLSLSPGGESVLMGVVLWRRWNMPLYWIVKDGEKLGQSGHYNEEMEFKADAPAWFSPDGGRVAYLLSIKDKKHVMIDDEEVHAGRHVVLHNPWSADGKELAFVVGNGGQDRLIAGGRTIAVADEIRLIAAPSSYTARNDDEWTLYIDGAQCMKARSFLEAVFSDDGTSLALALESSAGSIRIVHATRDCKVQETWGNERNIEKIRALSVSPDGTHIFFAAMDGNGKEFFHPLDGQVLHGCGHSVRYDSVVFAGDSSHTAWIVDGEEQDIVCLDGAHRGAWDRIETPLVFGKSTGSLTFYAWKKRSLYKVNIDFEQPCKFAGKM